MHQAWAVFTTRWTGIVRLTAMHCCSETESINWSSKSLKIIWFSTLTDFQDGHWYFLSTAGAYQKLYGFLLSLQHHCCQVGKSLFPRALVCELSSHGRFSKKPSPAWGWCPWNFTRVVCKEQRCWVGAPISSQLCTDAWNSPQIWARASPGVHGSGAFGRQLLRQKVCFPDWFSCRSL